MSCLKVQPLEHTAIKTVIYEIKDIIDVFKYGWLKWKFSLFLLCCSYPQDRTGQDAICGTCKSQWI